VNFLQTNLLARIKLVFGQMGPPEDVGIDRERIVEILGERGSTKTCLRGTDRLAPLDAKDF